MRKLACLINLNAGSFNATSLALREAAGLEASKEYWRQCIEAEGDALTEAQRDMLPPAWEASDCKTASETTRVYMGCDGVMAPVITEEEKRKRREKVCAKRRNARRSKRPLKPLPRRQKGSETGHKELKLVTFYSEDMKHSHAVVTSGNHRAAQVLMSREARNLKLHQADQRVAIVDGAVWIRSRLDDTPIRLDGIGLDFYHFAQHVYEAATRIYGEKSPEGRAWASEALELAHNEGYDALWESLQATRRTLRGPRRKALDGLLGYISRREDMIQYPHFRAQGWQIGSGPTEARCKTATARLTRPGMRWTPRHAQALASLAMTFENGQWDTYWTPRSRSAA